MERRIPAEKKTACFFGNLKNRRNIFSIIDIMLFQVECLTGTSNGLAHFVLFRLSSQLFSVLFYCHCRFSWHNPFNKSLKYCYYFLQLKIQYFLLQLSWSHNGQAVLDAFMHMEKLFFILLINYNLTYLYPNDFLQLLMKLFPS